jgi:transcriptional regulator
MRVLSFVMSTGSDQQRSEILQGTLDLMVLTTLDTMGPLHGFGLARRIEQVSEGALQLNQGTIYIALLRLLQKRWITSEWGTSANNRRAKFYSITRAGKKRLHEEVENWERVSSLMLRFLRLNEE